MGFSGQNSFIEFGSTPYNPGEEPAGIPGELIYASRGHLTIPRCSSIPVGTRTCRIRVNLYQDSTAPDGSLAPSWWTPPSQQFRAIVRRASRSRRQPNMNWPGQGRDTGPDAISSFSRCTTPTSSMRYNNGGTPAHTMPSNSQFKLLYGMHNWNQVQSAAYDRYVPVSQLAGIIDNRKPTGGRSVVVELHDCIPNPDATVPRVTHGMLPAARTSWKWFVPPGLTSGQGEDKKHPDRRQLHCR